MNERRIKQVIVIRKDLKMRRGKEIAQGSHASMAFISRRLQNIKRPWWKIFGRKKAIDVTSVEQKWFDTSFAKVTVRVNSLEELEQIYESSKEAGLEVHLVTDSGLTEFAGQPTKTCLAIGPNYADLIDPVTGELKIY